MSRAKTPSKQRTLEFFFSPQPRDVGSPDLKHFSSERRQEMGSPDSRKAETVEAWMECDLHDSDDEPIANRKRATRGSRSPTQSALDVKRLRQEGGEEVSQGEETVERAFGRKLELWDPQLTFQMDRLFEDPNPLGQSAEFEMVTGLNGGGGGLREMEKFPFLSAERIRDANGRRPGEEGYDATTLYIPPSWFDACRISEAQRQWWTFKASNFDALLLFKIGAFYELYEMDAHVGVEALGLKYMKGDRPHCGFPEKAYAQMASMLAEKGYKVVVIEQTERPNELMHGSQRQGKKSTSKVKTREKVAVITKGTLRDADMMEHRLDANYLMSICGAEREDGCPCFGFCAVDVASSQFILSQFGDDDLCSHLRTQISMLDPVEFILPIAGDGCLATLKKVSEQCAPSARVNVLKFDACGFPNAHLSAEMLESYFAKDAADDKPALPEILKKILGRREEHAMLLSSCGAAMNFLKNVMLDSAIIPISTFHLQHITESLSESQLAECVFLDSSALENLEVFRDADGKATGSLFACLDHCMTPFGKRLLKKWISKPLIKIQEIQERQDAIQDLLTTAACAAGSMRNALATVGDLERALSRLHSSSLKGAHAGRDADHVILYEDATKRKVTAFVSALIGLQSVNTAISAFGEVASSLKSSLLRDLITPGRLFPAMDAQLNDLMSAADWDEAQKTGRIVPAPGVVPAYDAAKISVEQVEKQLEAYKMELRALLGARNASDVSYVAVKKEKYIIEVADRLVVRVPSAFVPMPQRKGFKRFTSPQLKALVQELEKAEDACEEQLDRVLHDLLGSFVFHHELWNAAVEAVAQLDVLMSLSTAAVCIEGPTCRPTFIPHAEDSPPVFKAENLSHPNLLTKGDFVPNDIHLGGSEASLMVLTGANMGGKSTLLRQVCLACLMAQVGAFVPAASLALTPVDAIFVRMGARDHIVCGQSTFFVELSETASMLRNASCRSLVALDELGRGTATKDGEAIAHAVVEHLSTQIGCRGVFATHYHSLAKAFGQSPQISVKHMACELSAPSSDHGMVDVKFLYKLADGVAPRSYGMNVARLAGLAEPIIEMANEISAEMERRFREREDQMQTS